MAIDPVCRNYVDEQQAQHTAVYQNRLYYFCCPSCQRQFEREPGRYLRLGWWRRFLLGLQKANAREFGGKRPSCH